MIWSTLWAKLRGQLKGDLMRRPAAVAGTVSMFVTVLCAVNPVGAHVMLDYPNGGEVLEAGAVAAIEWHVVIGHATNDWDLWYSVNGSGGPWIVIIADLPPGDITTGAIHTFDWTVPGVESDQVRVRVRQDNIGTDYEDVSDGDLTIQAVIFGDGFESGTTGGWSMVVP